MAEQEQVVDLVPANEELMVVNTEPQMLTENEPEDPSMMSGILLPTYQDTTDQGVLKQVREVFRGFSFDMTEDFGKRFKDTDQLASYVTNSMEEISQCRHKAEASEVKQRAAAMARFWCMGSALDKAIKSGSYGTAVCNKLAATLHKSVPYIYQIRAVADRLTVTDCYLLGMRGCDSTTIRRLAQIKDDAIRKGILKAFIDTFTDTADKEKKAKAKAALITAINMDAKSQDRFIEASTSDPAAGGSDILVSEAYQNIMKAFQLWQKMLKKPAQEEGITEFCAAAADFSICDTVPDAEVHLDEVKTEARKMKAIMQSVINNMNDAIAELESLEGAQVLKYEAPDSEAGN